MDKPKSETYSEFKDRLLTNPETRKAYDELELLYTVKKALIEYSGDLENTVGTISNELVVPANILREVLLFGETLSEEDLNMVFEKIGNTKK